MSAIIWINIKITVVTSVAMLRIFQRFRSILRFKHIRYDDIKYNLILTWRQGVGCYRKDTLHRANEDRSTFNVHAEPEKAYLTASIVVSTQPLRDPQAG